MKKLKIDYKFNTKRNLKLTTPCCNKLNKNGKFVNYKELPDNYGYCHSCGKSTKPLPIYIDDKGEKHIWNDALNKYEPIGFNFKTIEKPTLNIPRKEETVEQKYISEETIWKFYLNQPENNLLKYIRKTYSSYDVKTVFKEYALGSTKDGGIIFWNINKRNQVQKGKVSYYNENGKRTNKFNAPYKNENGFYSCLFGEHLIIDKRKGIDTLILVESEKTAIIGALLLPQFVWLSYSGRNGLTQTKYKCLIGHTVLIIPDMSEKDIEIMSNKVIDLIKVGVNASIWDMTNGRTDEQLKKDGVYNCDLEDVFRKLNY